MVTDLFCKQGGILYSKTRYLLLALTVIKQTQVSQKCKRRATMRQLAILLDASKH